MTDNGRNSAPVPPQDTTIDSLTELVERLVKVDLDAANQPEASQLSAEYRASLQALLTPEMSSEESEPDLHALLDAALRSWVDGQ
jgi:hypothetical protein